MDGLINLLKTWLPVITSVVGSFALIATMTKNKWDNKLVQVLSNIVNFLGANFGKSVNK